MKQHVEKLGVYAFLVGTVVAILLGAFPLPVQWLGIKVLVLAALGIVVGYLNVQDHELQLFLIATLTLIGVSNVFTLVLTDVPVIGATLVNIFQNLLVFFASGAGVLAIKAVLDVASEK
ncbi:TPA: hypothetical protein HA246_05420 [Candidatus Woesearchaeota archaeon]|nr:hypothetical protein [Candidatus Woesearchaeota archaeon]